MKRLICSILIVLMVSTLLGGCGNNSRTEDSAQSDTQNTEEAQEQDASSQIPDEDGTIMFTDSCGREVEIPANIERVAPSGAVAQMILLTVAADKMVGVANTPDEDESKYLPEVIKELPEFGQFYGKKANLNMEALIAADPQIIIDLGEYKNGIEEDMDSVQDQTGIPTVFIEASLENLAEAYRTLGSILGVSDVTDAQAVFIEDTINLAAENSAKITEKKTVMYTCGADGLGTNAKGSSQAEIIEVVGAENAIVVEDVTSKGGGNQVSLEQVYIADPDVIIMTAESPYDDMETSAWADLTAIKNGTYYQVPQSPYNWLSMPPSVNMIIGVWWLGQLVYPDIYSGYDVSEKAIEYYNLFWHYDLSQDEVNEMLARSILK